MNQLTQADDVEQYYSNSNFDPTESPHTDLDEVPERAMIQFDGESGPRTSAGGGLTLGVQTEEENNKVLDELLANDIGVALLIERAMLDPDATVIPRGA